MSRLVAVAAAIVLVAAGSSASAKPAHQLFGIAGNRGTADLVALDPRTLDPVGQRVRLGNAGPWSFSPDRNRLAVATGFVDRGEPSHPVRLRVVDLWTMRRTANIRIAPNPGLTTGWIAPVVLVAWLEAEHVLVLRRRMDSTLQLVTVDAARRTVVRRQPFRGEVLQSARGGRELVLLVGESEKLGEPRLVVIDPDGDQREVALTRMRAGWTWDMSTNPPVSHSLEPGFTVDAAARTAYVVAPSGVVAEISLDRLEPAYRSIRGSYAKLFAGSTRRAVSLGNGFVAIAGSESTVGTDESGAPYQTTRPTGLELLDTRTWTSKTIDPSASAVTLWRSGLLVTGRNWDSRRREWPGTGLALYDLEGNERFRVLDGRAAAVVGVYGDRAYVYLLGSGERAIIDLVAGKVLEQRTGDFPWLLLNDQ